MKPNPAETALRADMLEGRLVLDGFLGDDERPIPEIVWEDERQLAALGLTVGDLAAAMRRLTRSGMRAMGEPVTVDGYTVTAQEYMGFMGCPFKDGRRAAKRNTTVTNAQGEQFTWSDLGLHLIEAHGFFQGRGSVYRIEPVLLARFLGLVQPAVKK